jgi:hypothetical protein
MKKLLGLALVALPLLPVGARAVCWSPFAYKVETGGNLYFRILPLEANAAQLGPWYLYWPMEAHFVVPAPTGYPYWPGPQTLPPNAVLGPPPPAPAPAPLPPPPGAVPPGPALTPPAPAAPLTPASYVVPSYWYGR